MSQVFFSADVKPLFRAVYISHMKRFGVELDSYTYMSNPDNANKVLATLSPHDGEPPTMPPGGPYWTAASSHCSRSGSATDTNRDLFSRSRAAPV